MCLYVFRCVCECLCVSVCVQSKPSVKFDIDIEPSVF